MKSIASQDVAKRSVPMTKPKYTPEIRERAVQLLIESEKDYPSTWAAITAIAPKIGCTINFRCRLIHLKIILLKKPLQIGFCNKAYQNQN